MNRDELKHEGPTLSASDAAAVDALVDAGFDLTGVPEGLRDRAARAARLLDGLDMDAGGSSALMADAIMARIAISAGSSCEAIEREQAKRGWVSHETELSIDDAEALEALIGQGYDPRRAPSALRERAGRQSELLSLLDTPVMEMSGLDAQGRRESLVGRTLEAVQGEIAREAARMSFEPLKPSGGRFRIADVAWAAAAVVVGAAILSPMVTNLRASNRLAACASNMYAAGIGLGMYSGDHRESLPMASASLAGRPWWNVGGSVEESNSANLFTLARTKYVSSMDPLSCPGCAAAPRGKPAADAWDWASLDQVSVSFQNLFSNHRTMWSQPQRMVVLADRSPITLSSFRKEPQNPYANSPNHCGRGQWVLCNDGSAEWMKSPVTASGDNIWLPRIIEVGLDVAVRTGKPVLLIGNEASEAGNVFLGP